MATLIDNISRAREHDGTSELTAILSILKERPGTEQVQYTILVWLVGKILMPPYLPRIIGHVQFKLRQEILQRLSKLAREYREKYVNYVLTDSQEEEILDEINGVGAHIARFIPPLQRCLGALSIHGMDIKNLIIHTDEHSIPWQLALTEFFLEDDFLCNRYACGTILVDDPGVLESQAMREQEMDKLPGFIKHSKLYKPPALSELPKRQFCLIAGELGHATGDGKDLGLAYVEKLKQMAEELSDCKMKVHCFSAAEWAQNNKDPIEELRRIFRQAQIVHFTCHFVSDRMQLAPGMEIGPEDLSSLANLDRRPLVVLHGCASAGVVGNTSNQSAAVCRAFLNKGVGGCLATILPVNIPANPFEGSESFMEIFYKRVFKNPSRSYGAALRETRQEIRLRSRSRDHLGSSSGKRSYDPQVLFYQLYGDPRETLVLTREQTVAEIIPRLEELIETEESTTKILEIAGDSINETELLNVLKAIEGVQEVHLQESVTPPPLRPAVPLGDSQLIAHLGGVVVAVVASRTDVFPWIVEKVKQLGHKIKIK